MKTIIHIDDDETWRNWVAYILDKAGYKLSSFNNIKDANDFISQNDISLVITDGNIESDNDGYILAKDLYESKNNVLLLSGKHYENIPLIKKLGFNENSFLQIVKNIIE